MLTHKESLVYRGFFFVDIVYIIHFDRLNTEGWDEYEIFY